MHGDKWETGTSGRQGQVGDIRRENEMAGEGEGRDRGQAREMARKKNNKRQGRMTSGSMPRMTTRVPREWIPPQ
jgi:hypothetical protein